MRIFSRHHDYYDWVAGYGVNPQIVYERTPVSSPINAENLPWPMGPELLQTAVLAEGRYARYEIVLGIYPQVYRRWMSILQRPGDNDQVRVFASAAEARAHAEGLGLASRRREYWYGYQRDSAIEGRIDDARWRLVGAPIFVACPIGWPDKRLTIAPPDAAGWYTTDPILSDLRCTDVPAQDVFQRIQTFLRLDPPAPAEFDDALKIKAHGFDARSFRHRKPDKTEQT